MERVNRLTPDQDANWGNNDGVIRNGSTANAEPVNGTPTAWNSVGVVVNLVVAKRGSVWVLPGGDITNPLSITNAGALTVTGVLVTDTLPPGVSYLRSDAPFPPSQPTSGVLVWRPGKVGQRPALPA
jgi:uncharacterized repeat protein (TIGR01451 family)